jgi:hypothetical protein
VLGDESLSTILSNFAHGAGITNLLEAILMMDDSKKQLKIKKKNRKAVVGWLDANIPVECLSERLFDVMEKIETGGVLGMARERKINIEGKDGALHSEHGMGRQCEKLPVIEKQAFESEKSTGYNK